MKKILVLIFIIGFSMSAALTVAESDNRNLTTLSTPLLAQRQFEQAHAPQGRPLIQLSQAQPAEEPEEQLAFPPEEQPAPPPQPVPQPQAPVPPPPPVPQPQAQPVPPPQPRVGPVVKQPPKPAESPVSFFFDDADVFEVIQTVFGDILKVNYIIDPRVKGKVNFRTVTPIPKDEVLSVMEIILRINGVGFVEEKGLYRIIPITDVPKELVYSQVGKEPEKVAIEMFAFKNTNIKEAMPDLDNVVGLNVQSGTVRIIPIYRLNALMVVASSKEQMEYVRKWVEAFDSMFASAKPKVFIYPLQNSKAAHVAQVLQSIISGGGAGISAPTPTPAQAPTTAPGRAATPAPAAQAPKPVTAGGGGGGGAGTLVSPDTRVFADEITNSLIILTTPADYAFIEETIKKIDTAPRQVSIEGLVVDITLTDNLSFGFGWSLRTNVGIEDLKPFTTNPVPLTGDIGVNAPLAATALPATGFGFVAKDPSGIARLVITALEDRSKARVLAAPHILVADNREARIQIGQQIPIATSTSSQVVSTTTTGTTTTPSVVGTSTIQYKDIGIILKVKPQINDSGLISLELSQEISAISSQSVTVGGLGEVAIDKTEATSNLVARDGETIIIGGLIREDISHGTTGIPFLSRIPIIGVLFGSTADKVTRKETIILLTPHVMRNEQEAADVTSDYVDRYKKGTKDKEINKFIEERGKKEKKDDSSGAQDSKKQ